MTDAAIVDARADRTIGSRDGRMRAGVPLPSLPRKVRLAPCTSLRDLRLLVPHRRHLLLAGAKDGGFLFLRERAIIRDMENTPKKLNNGRVWLTVVLAIVVGLIGFSIGRSTAGTGSDADKTASLSEALAGDSDLDSESEGLAETDSVAVLNQPAGLEVKVDKVVSTVTGWISVNQHKNGVPFWVLGARKITPGIYEDFSVSLLKATETGTSYLVVLHEDNGDGKFEYTSKARNDLPLTAEDGKMIASEFTAVAE